MTRTLRRAALAAVVLLATLVSTATVSAAAPFDAALKLYEADRFPEAERALREIVEKSPADARARLLLGWSLWNQARYDEALAQFKRVLHEAPAQRLPTNDEYVALNLPLGIGYIENPDIAQARKGLGWTYFKKGWPRTALTQFDLLQSKYRDWDEPYLGRGYANLALGRLDRAEEDFREHLKGASDKRQGERALGDLMAARKQTAQAIVHYERALKIKPAWPEGQSALAWAYAGAGRDADAERLFTALRAARPAESRAGLARIAERRYGGLDAAWTLYRSGKAKEAAAAFDALAAQGAGLPAPARASIFNGLGWSRLALGDQSAAERAFQESLKAVPDGAEATAGLGWIALGRKDLAAAEKAFAEAAGRQPSLAAALEGLAAVRRSRYGAWDEAWELYRAGRAQDALRAFERLQATPGDLPQAMIPYVRAGAAWAQIDIGRLDEAERTFAELSKEAGDLGAEGNAGLGWIALRRNQRDAARARFLDALRSAPASPAALRGLVELRRVEAADLDAAWQAYGPGRFAEAAGRFKSIADKPGLAAPYRVEALRGLAWSLLRQGKPADAVAVFDALVAVAEDADALHGRGLALSGAGRHADARAPLARAASLALGSAEIHAAHGWAALKAGDATAAEEAFLKAYVLAPGSAEVNRALGWLRVRQNRPADAIRAFAYAAAQAPGLVDEEEFRKLLATGPYRGLKRDLAWGYVTFHAFDRARPLFEEAARADRGDADAQFGLGYTLYRLGRYAEADRGLEAAVKAKRRPEPRTVWVGFPDGGSYPILTDPWSIRGWTALLAGDVRRAHERFQESLERDPDRVSSLVGLGMIRQRSGDVAGARDLYFRAGEIYPTYPGVVSGLREMGRDPRSTR